MTPAPQPKARWMEMAKAHLRSMEVYNWEGEQFIEEAVELGKQFAQVAAEARDAALEEAAAHCERVRVRKWNATECALRIRVLKCPTKLSDGSDQ